jgi:dUTP pyrophosphatase
MLKVSIPFKKLHPDAKTPEQATEADAGYDLFALESQIVPPLGRVLIKTGIAAAIPQGYYGRIAPRSGLAWKHGLDVLAGVVDSGYRDGIGVILINFNVDLEKLKQQDDGLGWAFGQDGFRINKGDKVAQLIIEKCANISWHEVKELSSSERNLAGFGSTGN